MPCKIILILVHWHFRWNLWLFDPFLIAIKKDVDWSKIIICNKIVFWSYYKLHTFSSSETKIEINSMCHLNSHINFTILFIFILIKVNSHVLLYKKKEVSKFKGDETLNYIHNDCKYLFLLFFGKFIIKIK